MTVVRKHWRIAAVAGVEITNRALSVLSAFNNLQTVLVGFSGSPIFCA